MTKKVVTLLRKQIIFTILALLAALWALQSSGAMAAPGRQAQDLAVITNPPSNAVIQGTVQINGSADHPAFQFYAVEYHPEPVTGDRWATVQAVQQTPVVNGVLVTWDTTQVPDGSYTLRLRTVRLDGNYTEFFVQQVVVANTQQVPTDTPTPGAVETPTPEALDLPPTATPTDLPPTPAIVIEQPVVDTPTPRPVETSAPLEDPAENQSFIPTVTGFSLSPLRDACLYGGALMVGIFVFFGFLSALRMFIMGFVNRRRL
jgi:hypothetical protein